MRKYILIPEYRPLYAMRHCWGPSYGPLWKPTLTPVDVIGELLLQSGNEKLSIFEVVKLTNSNRFSEPVQLSLENYRLPYEEIVARSKQTEKPTNGDISIEAPPQTEPTVSLPTIEDEDTSDETTETTGDDPAIPADKTEDVDPMEPLVEKIRENFGADAVVEEPAKVDDEASNVNTENPYAGMTKAQRRAARRAARQAEQQAQETENA